MSPYRTMTLNQRVRGSSPRWVTKDLGSLMKNKLLRYQGLIDEIFVRDGFTLTPDYVRHFCIK